jgi:hypothetical protein
MRFQGRVVKRLHGAGSKSEHEAVYLDGPKGAFKLRLPDGNPFQDPRLDRLVGKSITADGELDRVSNQLFLSNWVEGAAPASKVARVARQKKTK